MKCRNSPACWPGICHTKQSLNKKIEGRIPRNFILFWQLFLLISIKLCQCRQALQFSGNGSKFWRRFLTPGASWHVKHHHHILILGNEVAVILLIKCQVSLVDIGPQTLPVTFGDIDVYKIMFFIGFMTW